MKKEYSHEGLDHPWQKAQLSHWRFLSLWKDLNCKEDKHILYICPCQSFLRESIYNENRQVTPWTRLRPRTQNGKVIKVDTRKIQKKND
jgi:hypothetical protein